MKKFVANQPLKPGLLWVLEQIPGYIHSEVSSARHPRARTHTHARGCNLGVHGVWPLGI